VIQEEESRNDVPVQEIEIQERTEIERRLMPKVETQESSGLLSRQSNSWYTV